MLSLTPHQPMAEQHSFMPQGISSFSLYLPHMAVAVQFDRQPSPQKSGPKPQIFSLPQQLPSTQGPSSHLRASRFEMSLEARKEDRADSSADGSSDSVRASKARGSWGGALRGFE
jgi:hypothetical protein